jgi:hypothetical protein
MPTFNGTYDWDQIPDVTTFKNKTAHNKKTILGMEKKRGRIEAIDLGIDRWTAAKKSRNLEEMIVSLADLSDKCDTWMNSKKKKNEKAAEGSTTNLRMLAVQQLKTAIEKNTRYLVVHHETNYARMELRKRENAYGARTLAPLAGGYKHERDFYVNSGKQQVASATIIHNKQSRSLSDMTTQDYADVVKRICAKNKNACDMIYLNKMSRSQYLVTIDDAKLFYYDESGYKEISTSGDQMVYAVDRYGNLFCIDLPVWGSNIQMNHSSVLAGKDVIGAGCLYVKDGSLRWIDNNSGHYRPTYHQLVDTLLVLQDQDLPLDDVLVGVMQPVIRNGEMDTQHVWFMAHDVIRASPQLPVMSLSRPAPHG